MSSEIRIALFGATGRMGREISEAASRVDTASVKIVCGIADAKDPLLGKTIPGVQEPIASKWSESLTASQPNVIVDFSLPEGTKMALNVARELRIPMLVGTTGLPESLDAEFARVVELVPVVRAGNTSIGINALVKILGQLTASLGAGYDVEIVETHHNKKKDAPSGTALMLGEPVAKARGKNLKDIMVSGRAGVAERKTGQIGFASLRGGDVVGDHSVMFYGPHDVIEVRHHAAQRSLFAEGAIRAALWLVAQQKAGKKGMFSMQDVIEE